MRIYPMFPDVWRAVRTSPRSIIPMSDPAPQAKWAVRLAQVAGALFIFLGLSTGFFVLTGSTSPDHIVLTLALVVFGAIIIRGPKPPDKMRLLNVIGTLLFIPLAPFYVNLIASKIWEQGWWDLLLETRVALLGLATLISSVLVITFLLIKKSEVVEYRRQGIYSTIRDMVPWADKDGNTLSYSERDEMIVNMEKGWAKVRLPVSRCRLLIAAGIPAEKATAKETQELTDENLQALAWLANPSKDKRESSFRF